MSNYNFYIANLLLFISLIFAIFSPVYPLPSLQAAESDNSPVTHLESIVFDEEGGKLSFPSFITADPQTNEIFIIDGKTRIMVFTMDLFPIHTLGKKNGIEAPQGLTVDTEGNLYIAQGATKDNPRGRISVFNACFKWDRDIYPEGFEDSASFVPFRLTTDRRGQIYVAGLHYPGVLVLDKKGKLLDMITPEAEEGKKAKLNNVALDKEGRIYLLSEEESHIYVYDENKKFLFEFGEKGGSPGKLSRPKDVAVDDRTGRKYVVDYMRHAVSIYDKNGKYLNEFGGLGWTEGWFQYPTDLAVDSKGRIFVSDTFNNRVQVFQPKE